MFKRVMPKGEIQKLIITEEVIRINSYFSFKNIPCMYISLSWDRADPSAKCSFL